MKILVVGGGGREHAIIKSVKKNKNVETIYALPGNGGIADDAVCVDIGAKDIDKIVEFAKSNDCYNLTLNVWSCNQSALKFYEKCGMTPQKIGMETIL